MTRETQREIVKCERCEELAMRLRPTFSPWEFEGKCETPGCGNGVTVSWAHSSPAPMFVKDGEPRQGGLFS